MVRFSKSPFQADMTGINRFAVDTTLKIKFHGLATAPRWCFGAGTLRGIDFTQHDFQCDPIQQRRRYKPISIFQPLHKAVLR